MATTARLGIDITATDRTRAAFNSTQRSVQNIDRSVRQLKGAFAGLTGGNLLAGLVRSLVDINKHTEPVKTALTLMARAWQDFALRVGSGGLNDALVNFVTRMGEMLVGSNRLANTLGSVLGAVVNGMTRTFEALGRAVGFVYDNFEVFKRILIAIFAIQAAERFISISMALVKMISAIRAASIATALFHLIQRRMLLVWVAIIAVGAKLTGTFDDLQRYINKAIDWAQELIPTMGEGIALALRKMGLDVTALTEDFGAFNGTLKKLPATFDELAKGAKAMEPFKKALTDLDQYIQGIKDQTTAIGMSEGALARLAQSQDFYNKMQDKGIKLSAEQRAEAERRLNQIPEAIENLSKQKSNLQLLQDIGQSFAETMTAGFTSIVDGSKSVALAIQDMVKNLIASLTQLFINKAFETLLNGSGGSGGIVGSAFKAIFGGGKAAGGAITKGQGYLVGEHGPEMFVPGSSGAIIPQRGSGGGNVVVNVSNPPGMRTERHERQQGGRTIVDLVNVLVDKRLASESTQKFLGASIGARPVLKKR